MVHLKSSPTSHLQLQLPVDEVHIWSVSLTPPVSLRQQLAALLDPAELTRRQRYHFQADRERFTTCRGLLRVLLGSYLSMPAERVALCCNPFGKPAIADDVSGANIQFNLSHSGGHALFAFASNRAVGIDLEVIRETVDIDAILAQTCSETERRWLQSFTDLQSRRWNFFRLWTCKEALLEAIGCALSQPLNRVCLSLENSHALEVLSLADNTQTAADWQAVEISSLPTYAAALVVRGCGWRTLRRALDWSDLELALKTSRAPGQVDS